ncbi:glycine zipper domain-containing protein [Salinarimonas sp. NSM]|uniref:glycine zipper domain-containing protein n=1 Tax=Salinarimonas sp. NSM TaxID=3458003 RepID=UPI004034F93E
MKASLLACLALVLVLGACSPYSRTDRALTGGAIGAGTGAVVGGAATRSVGGALVGGVIGGAAGAIIGAETTPRACTAIDSRGRRVAVQCR